jgi:hypothetical protein
MKRMFLVLTAVLFMVTMTVSPAFAESTRLCNNRCIGDVDNSVDSHDTVDSHDDNRVTNNTCSPTATRDITGDCNF